MERNARLPQCDSQDIVMTDKPKRPRDANQLAHMVAGIATGEVDDVESKKTKQTRKAGKIGGKARASILTSEQRSEIAQAAAQARWRKSD